MRLSLLSKASSSSSSSTRKTASAPPRLTRSYSLTTIFPALFALSSTVQVHCFASSPSFTSNRLVPTQPFWNSLSRGGGGAQQGIWSRSRTRGSGSGALWSTTQSSSDTTSSTTAITMTPADKLQALRARMKELEIDVYLVPSDDPHLSGKF